MKKEICKKHKIPYKVEENFHYCEECSEPCRNCVEVIKTCSKCEEEKEVRWDKKITKLRNSLLKILKEKKARYDNTSRNYYLEKKRKVYLYY